MFKYLCCILFCLVCIPHTVLACNPALGPVLECVVKKSDGTYQAYFGYNNTSTSTINASIGTYNKFTPSPQDRGQPKSFLPGRKSYVFSVLFNGDNLAWTLESSTSTASKTSKSCVVDCSGTVNGTKVVDQCGVCGGNNSTCKDCSGTVNGTKVVDKCGVCGGDNSTCKDCAGIPLGNTKVDQCGVCGGNNSTCKDCAGVINGESTVDQCGVCQGNGTSCLDCAGIVFGDTTVDQCGQCGGDNSSCKDCAGTVNGSAVVDQCGQCGGDNSSCKDCVGTVNGSAVVDQCGICAGNGTSCLDCLGVPNGSSVYDSCGQCAGDNSSCKDCAGTVNGSAVVDSCGICNGDGKSCDCHSVSIRLNKTKLISSALDLHAKSVTYYSRARECDKDYVKVVNKSLKSSKKLLNLYIETVYGLQTVVTVCGSETCGKLVNKTKIQKLHKVLFKLYELARTSNYVYRDACRVTVGPGRGDTTATYNSGKSVVDTCPSGKLCK